MASFFFVWFSEQEQKLFRVLSFVLSRYVHGLDF